MRALVLKELQELVRERRFFMFLTVFASVVGLGGMLLLNEAGRAAENGFGFASREPTLALMFVSLLACVLLALTFAADAIAKERDQGMLPLVLTSPVTHAQILASKVVMLAAVYASFALVNVAVATILSLAFGWIVLKSVLLLLALPLAAFFTFAGGLCLLLSATFRTSKASLAVAVATLLPMFIAIRSGPIGFLLRDRAPLAYELLGWLPVDATIDASMSLVSGAAFDAGPLALSALMGIGAAVVALFAFQAREAGV